MADPAVVAGVISGQRTGHNVPHTVCCRALGVSELWFCKWRKAEPTGRELRRSQLEEAIGKIFAESSGTYVSPKCSPSWSAPAGGCRRTRSRR